MSEDLIILFIRDILRYIENEEDKEYETNQNLIGMNELFHRYIVVVQEGMNINSNKYRVLNAIVVRKCVEFYMKCQRHRNKVYYNEEK